ncbi:hypothetical protein [Oerskovia enterophila]|uniref:FtsK/SpoIIIE family protein n=1 Tax=Oerskovia enterophila TaxID=43678 RepID=A0ABX2Y8J6_9CELL|nr:hypothetical protein [Oerskovia enterophila]OCI32927.1 FtsK/SpoIIIE family protein [Oerskovia enterophila]
MAAARTAPPTPPSASWTYPAGAVAAGVAGGVWALANGWPGVALVWVSFALAGWLTQPPTLTGPLDAAKRPTVANPAEKQGLSRYRFWSAMRWRVLTPNAYWWPLEPAGSSTKGLVARLGLIRPANVLALVLAAAAAVIPAPLAGSAGWVLSAVGAYATFAVVVATKRACANEMHPKPAVTFARVAEFAKESPSKVVGSIVGALVLGGASALVVLWFTPSSWGAGRWVLAGVMPVVWAWVLLARPVIEHTVTTWRALVAADEMWQPRWEMMKLPEGGRPFLIEHADLGESVVSVDTFRAPAALGAAWFHQDKNRAQIVNAVGAGSSVVVLSVPNTDAQGQPMPGTVHPLDVRVVTWSTGTEPDYATTAAPIDLVQLVLECAVAEAADGAKMARPLLVGIRPLTEPGTATAAAPQNPDAPHQPDAAHEEPDAQGEDSTEQGSPIAYEASWDFPQGGSYETLGSLVGPVQERMQVMVRVDHRSRQMFLGDLDAVPDSISQQIENLHLAAKWTKHWADALKQGTKGPLVQPGVISSAELANGTEVHCVPFAVGQGQNPLDFFGYEENLASTVNVAFITTTGFCPPTRGARPGERHNLGLTLLYSQAAVPMSPHLLAPSPGRSPQQAQRWVLAGMVNKAFDAAKMARPEVVNVKAMSAARSRGHIWALTLRLYGGVTTADVRRKVQVIAQTWGVPWVRLGPASEDTITLFAGANPSSVTLADPATDEMRITALDWEQAWADAKVVNPVTGAVPTLTAADRLEHNDKVQVLDFALPQGISASQAKGALDKLRTNTGNSFILFRTSPDGAAAIRVLCSPQDPVPFPAAHDFEYMAGHKDKLPFATGVEGEPIEFDPKKHVHVLVAGVTGGGKMQPLDTSIPVPISDRFPRGWATIGALNVGDEVFTRSGRTARISSLSATVEARPVEMVLSDGQRVLSHPEHLWAVSSASSRAAHGKRDTTRRDSAHQRKLIGQADALEAVAATIAPGTWSDLAATFEKVRATGAHWSTKNALRTALERVVSTELRSTATVPLGTRKNQTWLAADIADFLLDTPREVRTEPVTAEVIDRVRALGGPVTLTQASGALLGRDSTRADRALIRAWGWKDAIPAGPFSQVMCLGSVFLLDEALMALATELRDLAASGNGREVQPLLSVVTAQDVVDQARTGGRSNFAVPMAEGFDLPAADLPISPYLFGAWLGDGSSRVGAITVGIDDLDGSRARLEAAWGYPVRRVENNTVSEAKNLHFCAPEPALCPRGHDNFRLRNGSGLRWCVDCTRKATMGDPRWNVGLTEKLRELGVQQNKHIPATYLRASYSQRLALLQGVMDTDGTVAEDGGCQIDLTSKRLAHDVVELIRSLGIKTAAPRRRLATITEADPANPGRKRTRVVGWRWRMSFRTNVPVFQMQRKLDLLNENVRPTQSWNYVTQARQLDEAVAMRCIMIDDPEHLYLTDGFVPTHNSVNLQSLLTGAAFHDWDIYVTDPSKGAADFRFVEPYARSITTTIEESCAMVTAVYQEVKRRKDLNSKHGVGSFRELPEEVRPNYLMLVVDEFTSLIMGDTVPKATGDAEADAERDQIIASNAMRTKIGGLVGRIAREARSAGVVLVLATQKLNAKILDGIPGSTDLRTNLSRMLLGNATYGDRASALRNPDNAPPLGDVVPSGRGLWEGVDMSNPSIIQSWYSSGEQAELSRQIAARRGPIPASDRLDLSSFMPKSAYAPGVVDVVVDDDPAPGAPEEVIDAGRVKFSLNDLQAFTTTEPADQPAQDLAPAAASDADRMLAAFTAGQFAAPEPEPLPAALAAPVTGTSTLLVLDVPAHLNPSVLALLADANVETVWVSQGPADEANRLVGIDLASTTVGSPEHGWWKLDALDHLVASRPHVSRLVWLDPRAHEEMDLGLTHVEYAADLLDGVELVAPVLDADDGLSADVLAGALAQEPIEEQVVAVAVDDFAPEPSPVRPPAPAPAPADDDWAMGSVRPSVKAPPRPAAADDDWSMA